MSPIPADPRNDEHVILSGLHCAFMKFHNEVVDTMSAGAGRTRSGTVTGDFTMVDFLTFAGVDPVSRGR